MSSWPALPIAEWRDTLATLQLCGQIVGKIRLALTPKSNQWWNVTFYVTAKGLTTSPMPCGTRTVTIDFDLENHQVIVADSAGGVRSLPLLPRPIAEFYGELFAVLDAFGVHVQIRPTTVELPVSLRLDEDRVHKAFDAEAAKRFGRVLRCVEPVFEAFRARFRGKCSPVHFFWGTFDLAVSRHNGRRAPLRQTSIIERDAYDEELIALGFWPGDPWSEQGPDALFYSYTVPPPDGLARQRVKPSAAFYSESMKEFVLPYEEVRRAEDPGGAILAFAQSTYDAGATLAAWPREALAYP